MIEFSIFWLALVLMGGLFLVRSYELKTGRRTMMTNLSLSFDLPIATFFRKLAVKIVEFDLKRFLIRLSLILAHALHDMLHLIKIVIEKLQGKFSRFINMVKGKESLHRRGASSVYLKHIGEYKKELNKNGSSRKEK